MSTDFLTLADDEREAAQSARLYVTTRFFPPLPAIYGDVAVVALREYREHGEEARVHLPDDINPLPRETFRDEDGDLYAEAGHLLEILRLWHIVEVEEEPEPLADPCRECGERENEGWGLCEECFTDALRSGWIPGE